MLQSVLHYGLHLGAPLWLARCFAANSWKRVYAILLLTMFVDLDHLLATPVFDPQRMSIGFHPLHSFVAIGIYTLLLCIPPLRWVAVGLLLHMATDALDGLLSLYAIR